MSNGPTDGFGNVPYGGIPVAAVTPTDGYGPMGWGSWGDESDQHPKPKSVGGMVKGHDTHVADGRDTHRTQGSDL